MLQLLRTSFSPFGRCNRSGLVRLTCALIALQVATGILMWATVNDFDGPVAVVLKFGFVWLGFCAIAKRLHDIGHSAWWIPAFAAGLVVWSFLQTGVLYWLAGPAILDIYGPVFWLSFAGLTAPLIAVTVWVHYARGCTHANRHGQPPGMDGVSHAGAAPTPSAMAATGT